MVTLEKYTTDIWPVLSYCTQHIIRPSGRSPQLTPNNGHYWYLYGQMFYGFDAYLDLPTYYSEKAQEIYLALSGPDPIYPDLATVPRSFQTQFDPGRKQLIYEHMYTGSMFRYDMLQLHLENRLTVGEVCELVRRKYAVCWITREENKLLHKTRRPDDVFGYYASKGIRIVNAEITMSIPDKAP